ncbi:MAG TPA: restriction endonuclease subunit S [Candidatus Dormibacteraeota bacterium]|nr:restriction endonuclease subunit S [Candidatus Dormibacteraeota bacterium]
MSTWKNARLDNCCKIVGGATPSTSVDAYWSGDICWVTPKNLSDLSAAFISDTPRKLTQAGLDACAASILPPGSVLFSSRAPIGLVAINTVPMATNQGLKSFVPKPERVHGKFLYWWLRSNRSYLEQLGNGATFKEVSKTVVSRIEIPLPPLAEQRRIANVLDRAEALRAKRRAALAQLDTLTQSIFLDLFGDPASKGWPMTTIAQIAQNGSIRTGPFGSQLLHSEFVDKGVAVLGIDNAVANEFRWGKPRFIPQEKYRELERYTVRPGDVLITIMGTCGRCVVVPDDVPLAINTKHLCCITLAPDKCLPVFLHAYFLRHPLARRYLDQAAKGAIMNGLNMGIIKSMPIPLPPVQLQQDFARRVAAVEELKATCRTSLSELDALFNALQYRAFRGEL